MTEHNELPEMLTVEEAAQLLRTSESAIYTLIKRKKLPGVVKLGRRVLIRRDELRAYVGLKPGA